MINSCIRLETISILVQQYAIPTAKYRSYCDSFTLLYNFTLYIIYECNIYALYLTSMIT